MGYATYYDPDTDIDRWYTDATASSICNWIRDEDSVLELGAATGRMTRDSDIDLLYTLAPDTRLGWEIEDLNNELAVLFGRPVDLVSRRALNPRIRDHVLAEAQSIYAAA